MNVPKWAYVLLPMVMALSVVATALAIDTSSALYTSNINFNNLGFNQANFAAAQDVSGSALIDGGFMDSDALNAVLHQGTQVVASMPANNRIVVEGMALDDGGAFNDLGSEFASPAELDTPLLPITPAVDDAAYFGCDNPCRILTLDVGQEGIGDWAVQWEYFNGTTFVTASNVVDGSNAFKLAGRRTVSFDMPRDFVTTTVTGTGTSSFWVRAVVTSIGASTQQPIGNQGFYENGQWWAYVDDLETNEQQQHTLSMGGTDLVVNHQLFTGAAGITTPDAAIIELGDDYIVHWEGNLALDATGSSVCLVCKGTAFRLYPSGVDAVTVDVTGAGTTSLTVSGIPLATIGTTASHVIDVISDGTDLSLEIAGVGIDTGSAQTVTDNASNYEWMHNTAAVYGNDMYIVPTSVGFAADFFDSEAEWDTGVLTDIVSTAGQVDLTQFFNTETPSDDGFWTEGDSGYNNSGSTTTFGFVDGTLQEANAFYRFDNVDIAQGATITSALLRFEAGATDSLATVDVNISAIDAADAAAPGDFATAESVAITTALVNWIVPTFTNTIFINSPAITSVIQEIVDRSDWVSGNAIVIFVEDNGSTAVNDTRRVSESFESVDSSVELQVVVDDGLTFTNDFVELETTALVNANVGGIIPSWSCSNSSGASARVRIATSNGTGLSPKFARHGLFLSTAASVGTLGQCNQVLTASAGEIWSFAFGVQRLSDGVNNRCEFRVRWRDSGSSTISTVTTQVTVDVTLHQTQAVSALTAPALTASVLLQWECIIDSGTTGTNIYLDGIVACVCNPAPAFGDSSNVVLNPSFERVRTESGVWTSPKINPTATDVVISAVFWDAIVGTSATLTAQTSIDNQVSYQTITNGGSISGISPGDDLTGTTVHLRFNLSGTQDTDSTPFVILAQLFILDDIADGAVVRYRLTDTPGVLITDATGNGHNGTMSYPVQLSGIFASMGPIESTRTVLSRSEAIGVGEFASGVTGSATSLFQEDTGSGVFLFGVLDSAATTGDVPIAFLWGIIALLVILPLSALTYGRTQSLAIAALVLGAGAIVFTLSGMGFTMWMVIIYAILAVTILVLRPKWAI